MFNFLTFSSNLDLIFLSIVEFKSKSLISLSMFYSRSNKFNQLLKNSPYFWKGGRNVSIIFNAFLEGRKPPESSAWNRDLARWSEIAGINPKAGPKTPRKTIESWMLKAGIPEIEIYSRQGHDPITSLRHYQSLSFTDYEMRDVEKRLTEWGILGKGIYRWWPLFILEILAFCHKPINIAEIKFLPLLHVESRK